MAATLLIAALPAAKHAWHGKTGDFTHFWLAAQAMLQGQDIYASGRGCYIYPPLTAFIFQPLGLFSERIAATIWLACNILLTLAATLIVSKEVAARWPSRNTETNTSFIWPVATIATILTADKIRAIFNLGQTDCLMLLGFALVLRWMDRRPMAAGFAAGAAANLKYLTLIFVPYFLLKRNYRAAVAALLSFAFFMMLSAVEVGLSRAIEYAGTALGGLAKFAGTNSASPLPKMPDVAWDRSVSVTSALFRLTRSQGFPDPVAVVLVLLIFLGVMAAIIMIGRRHGVPILMPAHPAGTPPSDVGALEWTILVGLAVGFSPHTTARQLVLLLLVFVVAVRLVLVPEARTTRTSLIAAAAVAVAGLTLPPFGVGLNRLYWTWRDIGGASWCALVLLVTVVWAGASKPNVQR